MSQAPTPSEDPRLQSLREALARNQPDVVLALGMELGEQSADTRPILVVMREAVRRVLSDLETYGEERLPFYRHPPEHYYELADAIEDELAALGSDDLRR